MTEKQVIESSTKNALEELQKLKEKLEKAIKEGADVDVQIDFKRQIKAQKVELKDRKCRIKDKVRLAKCQHHIAKLDKKIAKAKEAEKPDDAKIARMSKRREWWITRQEKARIAEEKRLQKRIMCYKKDQAKIADKVKFCQVHPHARHCPRILEKYQKDAKIILQAKTNERKVEKDIAHSREVHIKTFANNKDVEAKKAIIIHRYNIKVENVEKRIERLENRLKELSGRKDSERLRNTEKRIETRIEKLRNLCKKIRLEQDKTIVIKSTGPGECSTCDQKIIELLNKIYTVIIKTDHVVVDEKKPKDETVTVDRVRRVKKTRRVKKPHTWTTREKRWVTRKVLKHFKVKKVKNVEKTEYVTQPRQWFTEEKVNHTHHKWVDHKVLKTKYRDVTKKVPFEDHKWVTEKVLVNKPKKFRNQELIELPGGKFEWKDLGYETRMVPEWEEQRRYVKFQNFKEVTEKQPYQQWETEKKWTPYTTTTIEKKQHTAYEKVPVKKIVQVEEIVDEPRWVEEKHLEEYTKTHHGQKEEDEHYEEDEKYQETVKKSDLEKEQANNKQDRPINHAERRRREEEAKKAGEQRLHAERKQREEEETRRQHHVRLENERKAREEEGRRQAEHRRRQEEETRRQHHIRLQNEHRRRQEEETRRQHHIRLENERRAREEEARRQHHIRLQNEQRAREEAARQEAARQHHIRLQNEHRLRQEEEARRRANPLSVVREQRVAIKSAFNTYFRAHPGTHVDLQIWAHGWETWTMQTLANGKVAFRSAHGSWLCTHPGGANARVQMVPHLNIWETYDLIHHGDGTVSLRSIHGNYVRAWPGGTGSKIDTQTYPGHWERFRIVPL